MIQGNPLHLLLYLICGLVFAACAPTVRPSESTHVATAATEPETVAAVATEARAMDPSKDLICKSVIPTGTRFRQRICTTQAEWDRMQQEDREAGEKVQRKGVQTGNPQGN